MYSVVAIDSELARVAVQVTPSSEATVDGFWATVWLLHQDCQFLHTSLDE